MAVEKNGTIFVETGFQYAFLTLCYLGCHKTGFYPEEWRLNYSTKEVCLSNLNNLNNIRKILSVFPGRQSQVTVQQLELLWKLYSEKPTDGGGKEGEEGEW